MCELGKIRRSWEVEQVGALKVVFVGSAMRVEYAPCATASASIPAQAPTPYLVPA